MILACQKPIACYIVRKFAIDYLPTGKDFLAWNKLKDRFDPQTSNEKLQLKEKFTNFKLTDWKKSPDDWIITSQLDQIGHKITDKDFVMYVLGNLLEQYESKIESLEKQLDNQYDSLTVERMTNELYMKSKKICKKNDYNPDEDEKKERN